MGLDRKQDEKGTLKIEREYMDKFGDNREIIFKAKY